MVFQQDQIRTLVQSFEKLKFEHQDTDAWSGRDLMKLFGYASWQKFRNVIFRAMDALETNKIEPEEHIIQVDKVSIGGNAAKRKMEDFTLTRLGAYMVAQEASSKEYEAAAYARVYFAGQTRKMEIIEQEMLDFMAQQMEHDRLQAREQLKKEERGFASTLLDHGVDRPGLVSIQDQGNKVLFDGKNTEDMRWKLGIGGTKRAIADFLPTPVVLAKALAASLTKKKVLDENQRGTLQIGETHVQHNNNVRKALLESGVVPEESQPQEDIRVVAKRMKGNLRAVNTKTISFQAVPEREELRRERGNDHQSLFDETD